MNLRTVHYSYVRHWIFLPISSERARWLLYCRVGRHYQVLSSTKHYCKRVDLENRDNMHKISSSLIAFSSLGRPSTLVTAHVSSADATRRLTSKLYPASIFPIAIQNILWARTSLTLCPRGVAIGSIAQTISILIAVPLVAVTQSKLAYGPTRSFISVDWLHGIEQLLMAVPNLVMTSSMRQSVAALENGKLLPQSSKRYAPATISILCSYLVIVGIGFIHWICGGENWMSLRFFGGVLEPPTPPFMKQSDLSGAPSFAVWLPHWTMFIDSASLLCAMTRWSKCTGLSGWRNLAYLHLPWVLANATVFLGHLHKDKSTILKSLHPVFIFLGSISTLIGTTLLILERRRDRQEDSAITKDLLGTSPSRTADESHTVGNGLLDRQYISKCILFAALLSYASLCLTPNFS